MKLHTGLLNFIADKIKAKTYLEIGVFNPDHNFNKINCGLKVSVDPDPNAKAQFAMTSDEFFKVNGTKFDLIFIDGLHHADQVKKDIENAWKCLTPNGIIVIHDSNPPTEPTTCVPRGSQREWCGNVFQTICQLKSPKFTVDFDYGNCVIRKADGPLKWDSNEIDWEEFDLFRTELLNLVTVDEATTIIETLFVNAAICQ